MRAPAAPVLTHSLGGSAKWIKDSVKIQIGRSVKLLAVTSLSTVETSSDSNVWFLTSQLVFWKLQQVFTSSSTVGLQESEYQHKSFKLLQFLLTLGHKVNALSSNVYTKVC